MFNQFTKSLIEKAAQSGKSKGLILSPDYNYEVKVRRVKKKIVEPESHKINYLEEHQDLITINKKYYEHY